MTTNPTESLLLLMTERQRLLDAFLAETGLRPTQAALCTRHDEQGVVRVWLEPRQQAEPYVYLLFGEALDQCRQKSSEERVLQTQMALITFAQQSEMPPKFVEEAAVNLSVLLAP